MKTNKKTEAVKRIKPKKNEYLENLALARLLDLGRFSDWELCFEIAQRREAAHNGNLPDGGEFKYYIAEILGDVKDDLALMQALAKHPDGVVRINVAIMTEHPSVLKTLAKDKDKFIRETAIENLMKLKKSIGKVMPKIATKAKKTTPKALTKRKTK